MSDLDNEVEWTLLEDLALIGDRSTVAISSKRGEICWFCPDQFDADPIFASLLDPVKGGTWAIKSEESFSFSYRSYLEESAVLETHLRGKEEATLRVTDFMPTGGTSRGLLRKVESFGLEAFFEINLVPSFGKKELDLELKDDYILIQKKYRLYSSEKMITNGKKIKIPLKKYGTSWAFLSLNNDDELVLDVDHFQKQTLQYWSKLLDQVQYDGPYEKEFRSSILALKLLTHQDSGAILAAATTSLPEVIKGSRNYDYRYVWLRDTAMIVSALVRAGDKSDGPEKFLDFICDSHHKNKNSLMFPFFSLEKGPAPKEKTIEGFEGYLESKPVVTGNQANEQLQLDANGNVLIAAKLIYKRTSQKPHWEVITAIADFLCDKWDQKDHGIWEESATYHYTGSKVIAACALEYIAQYSESERQKKYWLDTSKEIRKFIENNCISEKGYYKLAAEIDDVDVSSALFPTWGFVDAKDPVVLKTIAKLEEDYMENNLFYRRLVCFEPKKEGAFLAGSVWMAQYYIYQGNLMRFKEIFEEVLKYTNDLGFISEEADLREKKMLGNFPQTFVHASIIGAIVDFKAALSTKE